MAKDRIALNLQRLTFQQLHDFAIDIFNGMTAAAVTYPTPVPILATLTADTTALQTAITNWGVVGARGSHADYLALLAAAQVVKLDLVSLANYCENTTPYSGADFTSANWPLRDANTPQGILQKPQAVHQFISPQVQIGDIKISWTKPNGLNSSGNVKSYNVYRSLDSNPANKIFVATVTKTTFTDTPTVPFQPKLYYWVEGVNTNGAGVLSDITEANWSQI